MTRDFELPLEIFGQDPATGFATPFIFFWPLPDHEDASAFVTRLQTGLDKISEAIPWVAGKVVKREPPDSHLNDDYPYKIVPSTQTPKLIFHDHRSSLDVPSMDELTEKKFPIRLLDESVLSPVNVLPGRIGDGRDAVLIVQLNRLRGGLAINIVGNHQVLDGTGQEQLIYLLDKACRGEAFDEEEIATANLDKVAIIQPFDSDWQPPLDTMYINPPSATPTPLTEENGNQAMPAIEWVNWALPKKALTELKKAATGHLSCGFVSTDDVLTAFIWQTLARVRLRRLGSSVESTIGRAVNPRRHVGIPAAYPGHISNNAFSKLTLRDLSVNSLGQVSSILRMAVDPSTSGLRDSTREFATLLHRATDKSTVSMSARLNLDSDLMLSSWASMRCYQFTFGLDLGNPSAFRRPKQAHVPSLVFLLPRNRDGEIVVKMGIRKDDLYVLQKDKIWIEFAEYIG